MSIVKQIQEKFWQNEFVLQLTPEERYFYMYLITNTMTNICGIYKFNLKLAELETGLTCDVIEKHLRTFESYGKLIISKTSKEIMIVNWFKHNFKSNKKTIAAINYELKEVKDKEFMKKLYEICLQRQYAIDEIFNGVIITSAEKMEDKNIGQALVETTSLEDKVAEEVVRGERKETEKVIFSGLKRNSKGPKAKKRKVKVKEEVEELCNDMIGEDDIEETIEGKTINTWNFQDSGGNGTYSANSA